MPEEVISNSLEDLSFNVFNVRQMTAIQTAPNGQTHVEPLPLFLVTLTSNIKYQGRVIEFRMALCSATTAKTSAMSRPTVGNPCNVCGEVVTNCMGNALKR
jgi:hypothetical protein